MALAGKLEWRPDWARFQYAQGWLASGAAYALDPRNLPLGSHPYGGPSPGVLPGVFLDAAPDAWGRHLLERSRGQLPASPLELLRLTNGAGTGALRFSQHRERLPPPRPVLEAFDLEGALARTERAAWALTHGDRIDATALQRLADAGSSLGGARPKALVRWQGREWIAKFSRAGDTFDVPRAEHASLRLAARAGITVPDTALLEINGRSTLLVARFDRGPAAVHYLSFHALLSQPRINPAADVIAPGGLCTYGGFASLCRHAGVPNAGPDLFRRMVFNLVLGNTDDHPRNHGLLYSSGWRLAPAFDLVPTGGALQAIGVGTAGRERTLANALSDITRFGLSVTAAQAIVGEVTSAFSHLDDVMDEAGILPADADLIRHRVAAGPAHAPEPSPVAPSNRPATPSA